MYQPVVIKANSSGIIVVLDQELEFQELKEHLGAKFQEASRFLGDASVVLSLEGRDLTRMEEQELLDVITENSDLHIVYLLERSPSKEEYFRKTLNEKLKELESKTGQFYKGNIRAGEVAEFETSVVILGDVSPGAKVISRGNIVVIGALKGMAAAGMNGNTDSYVMAMKMKPSQIRIGDYIAIPSDDKKENTSQEPQIAYLEKEAIYVETLGKNVIASINF